MEDQEFQTAFNDISENSEELEEMSREEQEAYLRIRDYESPLASRLSGMFDDIERERRESFTVAIDKNCVNVFGGR